MDILDLRDWQRVAEELEDAAFSGHLRHQVRAAGPSLAALLVDPALSASAIRIRRGAIHLGLCAPTVAVPRINSHSDAWADNAEKIFLRSLPSLLGKSSAKAELPMTLVALAADLSLPEHSDAYSNGAVPLQINSPLRAEHLSYLEACHDQGGLIVYVSAGAVADLHLLPVLRRFPGALLLLEQDRPGDARIVSRLAEAALDVVSAPAELDRAATIAEARRRLFREWAQEARSSAPGAIHQLAAAVALGSTRCNGRKRLLFDVTKISRRDLGTGIQRVTREIARRLAGECMAGREFVAVRIAFVAGSVCLVREEGFLDELLGRFPLYLDDHEVIEPGPADIFLGIDVNPDGVALLAESGKLSHWRASGMKACFMIHDLLPLQRPDDFPPGLPEAFYRWLSTIANHAEMLLATTSAGERALGSWLKKIIPDGCHPPSRAIVPLGADFAISCNGKPALSLEGIGEEFLLMVGTIEPRKGHTQILDAMEEIWGRGREDTLVIVGRSGWGVEALIERIVTHPDLGRRLHWLDTVSDDTLDHLLSNARGLIMASLAEGFGLPLAEAAFHGVPVFARDIPVFREIGGDGVRYFGGQDGALLADALEVWLHDLAAGTAPAPSQKRMTRWDASTDALRVALANLDPDSARIG